MSRFISTLRNGVIAVAVLAPFVFLGLNWSAFPESVPSHFGITGQPDAWGPRWMLLPVPLVGLVLVSLLTIGKRFPNLFNYPVKITPENAELQHTLAIHFLDRITIVSAVMLGYLSIQQMRTALNLANGLGAWTMLLLVAALFGTIGAYLIRALRAR